MTKIPKNRAFTLVELLIAIAVMSILLFILLQVTGNVTQTTQRSHQKAAAAQSARQVLDAIAGDLDEAAFGYGLGLFAKPDPTKLELAFLTQRRGTSGTSPRFVAVNYRLVDGALIRELVPVEWNDKDLLQKVTRDVEEPNPDVVRTTIATGVLRFQAVAILSDGTTAPISPDASWLSSTAAGQEIANAEFRALGISSPFTSTPTASALIIAVATLDQGSYELLSLPVSKYEDLLLPASPGETPVQVWNASLNRGDLSSFPKPAAVSLTFSQNTFELN